MTEKNKVETKKTNKILVNLLAGVIIALIATVASYNYWHYTNIRVTFNADSEKDIFYQVFYTEDNKGAFKGELSARLKVESGSNFVKIILPTEKVGRLRLDTGSNPGELTLKDIKISGDETVEFKDFGKYRYNKIDKHTVNDDGSLAIVSDKDDPYIITTEELEIYPGDDYDWLRMGLIAGGSFIVAFLLAMLINRKKK